VLHAVTLCDTYSPSAPRCAAGLLAAKDRIAPGAPARGNTVVLKSSEFCPKSHSLLIEIMNDCGLPPGVANLVTNAPEDSASVVDALIGHPAVRRVNFTGSTRVGRMVAETCASHLKHAVLELSGKAPMIVMDDADLDAAVAAAAYGAFFNQGQLCISTERIVVDQRIADEFVHRLAEKAKSLTAGDPRSGLHALGSMISTEAAMRVQGLVEEAVERGAELMAGGRANKTIMQPTVLDHVDASMRLYHEESFGPVATVIRVLDEDEAVSVANDTEFGLAASVFTRDLERARRIAHRLETGICQINGPTVIDDPNMPFGGVKNSGYGKLGGAESVCEFTELRWIAIHERQMEYPF
jgi:acyl-CoA reductase-like NAD-dependent aldehyde dehydrogenase